MSFLANSYTRHSAQSSSIGTSSTPQFLPFASTGELLISKNKHLITLLNARNYNSPFYASCLSPDIHLEQHGVVLKGIDAFINAYRIPAEESPHEVEVEVKNSSAIVDEKTGNGTVVLHVTATGQKDDMKRAATVLSCWRRMDAEGGKWECHSYYMFFGVQEFD